MTSQDILGYGLAFILLLLEGIKDIKRKSVSVLFPSLCIAIGIVVRLLVIKESFGIIVLGFLPGIALLFLARITAQKIGYGDALLTIALGSILGLKSSVQILFFSFFFSAVFAILLLCFKKANKKTEIPFVPFMMPAYFLCIFLNWRGF